MALRKSLAERLFNITKTSRQALTNYRISSTASAGSRISQNPTRNNAPDPGDNGVFRRFLHKAAMFQPRISPVGGENLMEKLITIDIARDRIRLDGLSPPPTMKAAEKEKEKEKAEGLTVEEAKKVLRAVKMEMVKDRLRMIERNWIPYSEFVRVCEEACSDRELGLQFAKSLDDAGNVIVLGNVVFLKPEQVTKAIEGVIPLPSANPNQNHPRRKEYEEMEKQKAVIDKKADALVRRELWCGLGYFVVQTAAFMRLTFWELSWDVMEPVCFFVTSSSVIGSYLFFLKTAKEPTFGGFYKSRFSTKQKKLMKLHDFDVERYNQLRKIFYPHYSPPSAKVPFSDTYTDTHTSSDYDENLKISALGSHH